MQLRRRSKLLGRQAKQCARCDKEDELERQLYHELNRRFVARSRMQAQVLLAGLVLTGSAEMTKQLWPRRALLKPLKGTNLWLATKSPWRPEEDAGPSTRRLPPRAGAVRLGAQRVPPLAIKKKNRSQPPYLVILLLLGPVGKPKLFVQGAVERDGHGEPDFSFS